MCLKNHSLSRLGLIKNEVVCEEFQTSMRYAKYESSIDGNVSICRKICFKSKSIRTYLTFSKCILKLGVIFCILFRKIKNNFYTDIEYDLNVNSKNVKKIQRISKKINF
ncbi:hypothetical protein DMUE_3029 [Dictyocoela muelleri]|nr:hypothetical protein DMUE_3029 [Dictyocoela muelleri]